MASGDNGQAGEGFSHLTFMACNPGAGAIAEFAGGQIIYAQGDPADALYYIIDGTIKISVVSEQGREGIIALLGPGSFFGEGCLDGRPARISTVTATCACKLMRLRSDVVMRTLSSDPAFSRVFIRFLLGRTEKLKADLIDQLFNSSEKRLARILMTLAKAGIGTQSKEISFPVNQELLASMVGTTRSRINHFMNKFRKLGYIEYKDHIKVNDSLVNVILEEPSPEKEP